MRNVVVIQKSLRILWVGVFFTLAAASACPAYVFDWTGRTFTGTSTTYTNVDGSGVDITVSFHNATAGNPLSDFIAGYPTVSSAFPIDRALDIYVNYDTRAEALLIRIDFTISGAPAPITNVVTQAFDLDTGTTSSPTTYRDQIRNVHGERADSSTFGATLSSSNHDLANNGTTTASATARIANGTVPDNSSAGTVGINFGSNTGYRYEISYGNINNGTVNNNPAAQAIGIGNISFSIAVPEPSSLLAGVALLATGLATRRRKIQRL